ncbi:MAG: NUDIX domain-containing protein, partial [Bacteroidales bacterium]|nr:NUDIX domain-containing protein [Bacteroidales bacterium]
MKHIEVVCAVIEYEGKFLCMQRANRGSLSTAGKWEFPGGKIEPEESQESALRRELQEEMDYEVDVVKYLMTVCHQYPDFHITM